MAKKETVNEPKDLVEVTPENIKNYNKCKNKAFNKLSPTLRRRAKWLNRKNK